MSDPRLTGYLAVGLVMAAACATYGRAEESARCVSGSLLELRDANGQRLPRLEASGIAYYQGRLVVVDDIVSSLFIFDRVGKLSETVALTGFPPEGSKFEDLAIDPATHSFFAVGSHSGWDRDVLEATSVLLRFRLGEGSEGLELYEDRIEAFPLYKSFEKLGLWRPMGMKIEGLAVDPKSAELYVGLREPIDRARIYGISLLGLERAARGGTPPDLGLEVSFDAGKVEDTPFSISALLWIPHRRGLLIATSTEDDTTHSFLGNRLWFYSREGQVALIQDTFDRGLKAEGLAMDEGCLYISYDNDQDDTEIPSQIRILPLSSLFDGQ